MKRIKVILLYLIVLLLFSCVEKRDLSKNTVIVHFPVSPDGLHPFNDNSAYRTIVFNYTQQTLMRLNLKTLEVIPSLIKNMPTASEDGLEYTYELTNDAKWDDGSRLTVDDVIFTTKITLAPLTDNAQLRGVYSSIIESVRKHPNNPNKFIVKSKTLHVSNKEIYEEVFLQQKSLWDPKGVLDDFTFEQINDESYKPSELMVDWFNQFNDATNSFTPKNLVGLGPYKVTEFIPGSYIALEKKENWYGDNSDFIYNQNNPEKIIFKIITDDAATYLAVKNQQLDVVSESFSTSSLLKLQQLDYFNANYYSDFLPVYSYEYIGLNIKPDGQEHKPFFTDKNVRRAMAHLVPVKEMIEVIEQGRGERQATEVSPLKKWYNTDLKPIELNIEKAKKLLDAAGWVDTDGDNIRDKVINGEKLQFSFKLSYMIGKASYKEKVLMIKEEMYKAGINLIPAPMDFAVFYKNAFNHKFDAMYGAWGGGAAYQPPNQLWHTESWANKGANFTGFGDAESDSLIFVANTSLDKETHYKVIKAFQKKIYDEQPYIFLNSRVRKIMIHKRFDNAEMYNDKPGLITNNLLLKSEYSGLTQKPIH